VGPRDVESIQHCFAVSTPDAVLYCAAEDSDARDAWIAAVREKVAACSEGTRRGLLVKRAVHSGRSWSKRFFMLGGDSLTYYQSAATTKDVKGMFALTAASAVDEAAAERPGAGVAGAEWCNHGFAVLPGAGGGPPLYMAAESAASKAGWVGAIRANIAALQARVDAAQPEPEPEPEPEPGPEPGPGPGPEPGVLSVTVGGAPGGSGSGSAAGSEGAFSDAGADASTGRARAASAAGASTGMLGKRSSGAKFGFHIDLAAAGGKSQTLRLAAHSALDRAAWADALRKACADGCKFRRSSMVLVDDLEDVETRQTSGSFATCNPALSI
jgi:hypothetical protein